MDEKTIQKSFGRQNSVTGVFEIKLVKEKRFNFKRLADHQEKSLLNAESITGEYHKLSDMSADYKPWDCQRIANTPAYVVLVWYVPRKNKTAYYIRIRDFIAFKNKSKMASITEDEASEICEQMADLTK